LIFLSEDERDFPLLIHFFLLSVKRKCQFYSKTASISPLLVCIGFDGISFLFTKVWKGKAVAWLFFFSTQLHSGVNRSEPPTRHFGLTKTKREIVTNQSWPRYRMYQY
jgi:hypothetical protein